MAATADNMPTIFKIMMKILNEETDGLIDKIDRLEGIF